MLGGVGWWGSTGASCSGATCWPPAAWWCVRLTRSRRTPGRRPRAWRRWWLVPSAAWAATVLAGSEGSGDGDSHGGLTVVLRPCSGLIWTRPGLGSGEVVWRPRSQRWWRKVWFQVMADWPGLLEVETPQEKSSFWPWSLLAMATPRGCRSLSWKHRRGLLSASWPGLRWETDVHRDQTMEAPLRLSPRWRHRPGVGLDLGSDGWLGLRRLARGAAGSLATMTRRA